MKYLITFSIIVFLANFSFSQGCYKPNSLNNFGLPGEQNFHGINFQFYGDQTDNFLDRLLIVHPDSKRKQYTWKIKNVKFEGLSESVDITIHRGIHGSLDNCRGFFHTFKNEKYKDEILAKHASNSEAGILIYVRKGRKNALKTEDEAQVVREYLRSSL